MLGRWTRTYHTHLAPQDINELGYFIDIRIAKELANGIDARVVFHLELRAVDLVDDAELFLHVFGGSDHTAELEAIEIPADEALTTGTVDIRYENWDRAMAAYQQAVDLDPDFALAHAHLARGHALLRYFRHDLTPERLLAADDAAARATELAPDSPRVRLALGHYHLWAYRDIEKALEEFELAGVVQPDNAEILNAMGSVFFIQGRWEEALDAYQRAFELSPREAELIASAGWALWTIRRYPEAIAAVDQAINLAPDSVWPYVYKTLALWSWKGSATRTRAVLEALPATLGGWERWAWYWQDVYEGRFRDALDRLETSADDWIRIKMFARPNALFAAQLYELLDEPEPARQSYEHAREIRPQRLQIVEFGVDRSEVLEVVEP